MSANCNVFALLHSTRTPFASSCSPRIAVANHRTIDFAVMTNDERIAFGIDSKYVMFWYADPDRNEIPEYNGVVYNVSASFVAENKCGDTNGDNEIDLTDLTNISLYLLGDIDFTDIQKSSADVNADDKLDLCDLAVMKQYISKDDVALGKG